MIGIDEIRVNLAGLPGYVPSKSPTPYKPIKGEKFLKGPIPWDWLSKAGSAPGKALHVGILLWLQSGLTRSLQVSINQSRLLTFGVSRDSARRGLKALEQAQLIKVMRSPGRKPRVEIIPYIVSDISRCEMKLNSEG